MSEPAAPPPAPAAGRSPDRFPPQIKYIVGNEACERFSYYGLAGILINYMSKQLDMGDAQATETFHLFGTAVYFLPLIGGWLADRWLGRYWTILSISLFYCLGHGTLFLFGDTRAGVYAGLTLIAIGAGGIKPNVSAFVGDQFRPDQEHLLTKVFAWFYWSVNLGAAAAYLVIPFVHEHYGYRWAFGIPGIFMGLATLVFWLGTRHYIRQPPARPQNKNPSSVVPARSDLQPARRTKALLGILMMFAPIPAFWALYNQVNTTWVLQGNHMTPFYFMNSETMQSTGAFLVMIWVPVLTMWLYPLAERRGWRPTPLRRMAAGMLLAALSFIIVGLLQTAMDRGATLSIMWQSAPYVVLEAGEVLLSSTALEFAFAQAPDGLKSVVMSLWYLVNALGQFLIAAITKLNDRVVHATGAWTFFFYAALMLLCTGVFMLLATRFRYRRAASAVP